LIRLVCTPRIPKDKSGCNWPKSRTDVLRKYTVLIPLGLPCSYYINFKEKKLIVSCRVFVSSLPPPLLHSMIAITAFAFQELATKTGVVDATPCKYRVPGSRNKTRNKILVECCWYHHTIDVPDYLVRTNSLYFLTRNMCVFFYLFVCPRTQSSSNLWPQPCTNTPTRGTLFQNKNSLV
jgi:hypothetical protein